MAISPGFFCKAANGGFPPLAIRHAILFGGFTRNVANALFLAPIYHGYAFAPYPPLHGQTV